jgi:hypothetical protein
MAGQRLSREERELLAQRRLVRNLDALGVANMRTLEMKVSDSGPLNQRINPHVLTRVRNELVKAGRFRKVDSVWYHREIESKQRVADRLQLLKPIYAATNNASLKLRLGQTLEIAILRALEQSDMDFVGGFPDLEDHDDSTLYSKEEPPLRFSGHRMPGEKRFDFLAFHPTAKRIGIEAKNIREWIYPDRTEVRDLITKALASDSVPVLIGRRIPYVSFRLLNTCGMLLFENFNQLYPYTDAETAKAARQKDLLGYHDIVVGNQPNANLVKFITEVVYQKAEEYRARFDRYSDLLQQFATGELHYAAFAARVRRREQGQNEDTDYPRDYDPNDDEPDYY